MEERLKTTEDARPLIRESRESNPSPIRIKP
jgi:hypothetical protein